MMLRLEDIYYRTKEYYSDAEKIDERLIRFSRQWQQVPFAICYLDLSDQLPRTADELAEYQNRLLGSRYFLGRPGLQWNNYIYFIKDESSFHDSAVLQAKDLIERDRSYARKYVINTQEVESILRSRTFSPMTEAPETHVVDEWIAILKQPYLIDACTSEQPLSTRLQILESNQAVKHVARKSSPLAQPTNMLPPIDQFVIKQFRRYPDKKNYHFGDVNLIFGRNGVGKTSLLEAIELYYCGKTRRNSRTSEEYEFDVTPRGMAPQQITHRRQLQLFRDNNLQWYGVREEKSANLCDSFGRFNFLDTDAAINLSNSTDQLNDDLAKLLVGANAARIWHIIESLAKRVESELRTTRELHSEIVPALQLVRHQIQQADNATKESDLLRSAVRESLHRNNWSFDEYRNESSTADLVKHLATLIATLQQVVALDWIAGPASLDNCERYCNSASNVIEICEPLIARLLTLRSNNAKMSMSLDHDRDALKLLNELSQLLAASVHDLGAARTKVRDVLKAKSALVNGISNKVLTAIEGPDRVITVKSYRAVTEAARSRIEQELRAATSQYESFVKLRTKAASLAQELRNIASRILELNPSDSCPLCHTRFAQGQLGKHMIEGVDLSIEDAAQQLLDNIKILKDNLDHAEVCVKSSAEIITFCSRAAISTEVTVEEAMSQLAVVYRTISDAQSDLIELDSTVASLKAQGLTIERLEATVRSLGALGYESVPLSAEGTGDVIRKIEGNIRYLQLQLNNNAAEEHKLLATIFNAIQSIKSDSGEPTLAFAKIKEQYLATRRLITNIRAFESRFRWPESQSMAEWIIEAQTLQGLAAKLNSAIASELASANSRLSFVTQRKDLELRKENLENRIVRLNEALVAFQTIQSQHSLEKVTHAAVERNKKAIESIFSQIHSPPEFTGIGQDWRLIRKGNTDETPLTQISTGQRAAFALSVFLAQNSQLRSGPPVILIDDPIAHIDDLNALSFLDYLREIAVTGNRQIFFATANEKLAGLFERKFDFLGKDLFQRYNLSRF